MVAWYCKIDDVEHGPLSQDELVKMASEGRLSSNDLVRNEQKKKWYKAGSVKGLKFPADGEPGGNVGRNEPEAAPSSGTSAEAIRLLKGLTKKGADTVGSVATQPRPADDWKPAPSRVMQQAERKPLDPRTKRILWAAAAVILVLVLFPPHQKPEGYSMPEGWYFRPIFSPPVVSVKADKGVGGLDTQGMEIVDEIVEINGKKVTVKTAYVKAPMPIYWKWLFLECFGVIAIAAGAIGFLAARTAAAEIPDSKPAHPPRRKQV